jgi:hypothetical protein
MTPSRAATAPGCSPQIFLHFTPSFAVWSPPMRIAAHRKAIDQLDAQIVRVLNERTRHVLAIGEIKLKAGEEIYGRIASAVCSSASAS